MARLHMYINTNKTEQIQIVHSKMHYLLKGLCLLKKAWITVKSREKEMKKGKTCKRQSDRKEGLTAERFPV